GWLVSRDGVARITHDVAGIVESIATTSGESVQAGDPVIYFKRDRFLEDGRSSGDEVILELRKQLAAVDRRAELVSAQASIEQDSIATQLRG
ncbi:hypothetical protein OH796_25870, partial [Klebsiella pneumoniae]|uniref:hypothetical protein n=1 Tax=Klebsiella pneumoniae TaxID=573 RepID=UPI0021F782BE